MPVNQEKDSLVEKWAKELSRCFTKAEIQMTNKCMKRGTISLLIREGELRSQLHTSTCPVAKIENVRISSVDDDMKQNNSHPLLVELFIDTSTFGSIL